MNEFLQCYQLLIYARGNKKTVEKHEKWIDIMFLGGWWPDFMQHFETFAEFLLCMLAALDLKDLSSKYLFFCDEKHGLNELL